MVCAQRKLHVLVAVALIGGLTFIVAVVHYIHQSPYPIILSPLGGELGSRQNHGMDAKVLPGYVSLREQQSLIIKVRELVLNLKDHQEKRTNTGIGSAHP
ncbi:hypothetical protein chiPu_0020243 [Chiloscyllium punctatum]|uniref:Uncharacterized protein n=1 Tax=Chiloscyllium punctatum TaxID=137246 RepID=A0A401RUE4_CHIPU|nr:hypothetical protein [Chiloscyllium punctatum]